MFHASQVANFDGFWTKKLVFDEYGRLEPVEKDEKMTGDSPVLIFAPEVTQYLETPGQWLLSLSQGSDGSQIQRDEQQDRQWV